MFQDLEVFFYLCKRFVDILKTGEMKGRNSRLQGPAPINIGGTGRKRKVGGKKRMVVDESRMTARQKTGRTGEDLALEYLLQDGYKLLERNWHCRHKEIDLIMAHNDGIHIVEVKTRREPVGVEPEFAVDARKQFLLECAAGAFIRSRGYSEDVHFDIVSIVLSGSGEIVRISFIKDAFFPTGRDRRDMTI